MARITWLADVLRAAGCQVREDDQSWKTRGSSTFEPRGLIIHATAGGLAQGNDSAYNVLVNGRQGLAGPISQVMVERGTGRWRPVCSGRSNHALTGWGGNCSGLGNVNLIGIEFHHANTAAEPWTEQMLDNYARGAAAICRHMGWGVNRIALHKEHQPGDKSDTTFDGNAFRARVQRYLTGTPLEDDMPLSDDDVRKNWAWDLQDDIGGVKKVEPAYKVLLRAADGADAIRAAVAEIKAAQAAPVPVAVDAAEVAAALAVNAEFLSAVAKAVNDDAHRRSAE